MLLLLGILLLPHVVVASSLWEKLDKKQQELLKSGKQVMVEEVVPGVPWPEFHVYRLVAATPAQSAAVFWDVQEAPHYVPKCLAVLLEETPAPNVIVATYEIEVPIFSKEVSKVRDELKELPEGGYQVSWEVLKSKYSKAGRGSFVAVPHEQGALICYSNFVNPGRAIAFLLRKPAQEHVEKTAASIARHIEEELQKDPQKLALQVEQLQKANESSVAEK